ncbi:MAG: hypothetical protein L0Y71_03175 [Gemmataceae bacterium]|nr:hypothetical protein [Gemmataceae bacterium]
MPLRDHFRPPLAEHRSWEELHGAWPGAIAFRLNAILPPDYYCGPRVHLGSAQPTLLVETDAPCRGLRIG